MLSLLVLASQQKTFILLFAKGRAAISFFPFRKPSKQRDVEKHIFLLPSFSKEGWPATAGWGGLSLFQFKSLFPET